MNPYVQRFMNPHAQNPDGAQAPPQLQPNLTLALT